jgi:hypothetical protein
MLKWTISARSFKASRVMEAEESLELEMQESKSDPRWDLIQHHSSSPSRAFNLELAKLCVAAVFKASLPIG